MERSDYEKHASEHWSVAVKGKANPYTSLNGNMFSFLGKDGTLAVRLAPSKREAHNARHGLGPVTQYNAVMKDYVWVPDEVVGDATAMSALMRDALDFAMTLKPKATRKKT